ncbi:hypothetical protein ACSEYT_17540 [Vibrio cidicii]|uniref:hypothetical protein n=1 Tax=Vibrio cidicii TaxID=1763883 RepID=UPI003F519C24
MNSKTKCWMLLLFAVLAGCNDSSVANSNGEKEANQNTGEEKKITFEAFQASVLDSLANGDSYHDCGVSELDQDVTDVYQCIETSFNGSKPYYGFDRHTGVDTKLASASVMDATGIVTNWYYDEHCLPVGGSSSLKCESFVKSAVCDNPALRTIDEIKTRETNHQFEDRFFSCSNR